MHRLRCPLFLLLCLIGLGARPAAAGYYQDMPLVEQLRARLRAQEGANPEQAATECQAFLQQHPKLDPLAAVEVVSDLIRIRYRGLKQAEQAMQLADWALQQYGQGPAFARPLGDKAMILVGEKRPEEAVALIEKEWDRLMKGWLDQPGWALQQYCRALDQMGRKEKATAAMRRAIYENAHLLGDWWQGAPRGWMYTRIIDDLLARNQCDEALRWGKLQFMTCGWHNGFTMTEVAPVLKRIWVSRDLSDRTWQAFLAAQEDPIKPNPLAEVKLPDPGTKALEAQLKEGRLNGEGRIDALLALGRPGRAMLFAREYLVENIKTNYGDSYILEVFHGTDLNFKRAEAFSKWRKTGEGPNPVDEFLKQYPPEKEEDVKPQ